MAQKYTLASNTTSGDRLSQMPEACTHLSTGDMVMIYEDPSQADPNKYTLALVPGSAHTAPSTIATLSVATAGSGATFASGPLCLVRDSSDNLYVIGSDGTAGKYVIAQSFAKGAGLTWTQQSWVEGTPDPRSQVVLAGMSAVWCNTGGGTNSAGHIAMVLQGGTTVWLAAMSAGDILAGFNTQLLCASSGGNLVSANTQFCLDITPNGFGATTGLYTTNNATTTSQAMLGFSVSSSGQPYIGTLAATVTTGTQTATTKVRLLWIANNRWALVFPSASTSGRVSVQLFSSTASIGAAIDTDLTSNFPAPANTLSWDAASANAQAWVYGWSSVTATTMLRYQFTFVSDVTAKGSVISDDTAVGSGTNTTIRVVNQPVDTNHVDWQTYNSTTPFSLLGDFSALPATANVPTLVSPPNATAFVLSTGGTMSWSFSSPTLGDTQVSYAFRRQLSGGAVQWWNAGSSSWQGTEIFNASATTSVTFPSGQWTSSATYAWSVAVKGTNGTSSGYAAAWNVYSAPAAPTQPTLTATYQAAPNNRVALVVAGTGTDLAEFQVSRDGGVTWADVRGASSVAQVAGAATVYDLEAQPSLTSQYRVRQQNPANGIYAAWSAWSAVQTATPAISTFWLRDPVAGTVGMPINVKDGTFALQITENATVHYPLGATFPVVLADTIKGQDGSATFFTLTAADRTSLIALLTEQSTLLLQSNDGRQWYVRFLTRPNTVPAGVGASGYQEYAVKWVQVGTP